MGGGSQESESWGTQLPPWMEAAHKQLVRKSGEEAYGSIYPRYGSERIAGFTPEEQAGFGARQQMFERGDPLTDYAASELMAPGYEGREFDFGTFDQSASDQYMSPYMQNVVDAEKRTAMDEYARQQNRSDAERVASGARGGYREAVQQAIGGAQQGRVLADIQGRGSQRAFENAQQQFERDRGAAIQAARMGDASALEAARYRMARSAQASQLASQGQARGIQRIEELELGGQQQRAMEQAKQDLHYEDFMRQQNYNKSQYGWLAGIMQGVPTGMQGYTRSPGPSIASQAMGLGIGAAGLQQLGLGGGG
ncbi:MAG: hypothetical protein CL489_16655 [Acidobacteria bacterium]|nr:hypothetical protein [Acidobacteriota bacterium]